MTDDERDAIAHVVADLRERAGYYASLTRQGVRLAPGTSGAAPEARRDDEGAAARAAASSNPERGRAADGPPRAARGVANAAGAPEPARETLEQVREDLGDCQRCALAHGRNKIVFGQGNPAARLMFVGEAPGAEEDAQGLAFVGRAGQLLTDMIEKGLRIPRSDVFIANVIKCRPPGNRNPEPEEIRQCQPFLERQIRSIRPEVIVGLGKFAGQWLLRTAEPISRIRGRLGERDGARVMPTFHPAYLLRNPSAKKQVWEDLKVVRDLLGLPR